MGSNVTEWLTALDRTAKLVDRVVPGHGAVVTIEYLARQRVNLLDLGHRCLRRRGQGLVA